MWPWTDWKLRRALRRYRGERDLEAVLQMDWHRDLDLSAFFTDVEERLHGEEITRLRQKQAEYLALQNQINPHFLYNTLDSIAWMCEQGRNADAVKMVHALARLFRISISRGHELIPIAKELEHAESYLQIQMYRYKNQFTYTFDVDPDCLGYYCNKITLQPIIENSINHGLDLMVDEGRIDVRVRFDGDDIVFSVQDNGVGMSPEQLEAIMQHGPTDRTGIGIKPATYKVLSQHPNINGVKEASGNIAEYALTRSMCGDDLVFWSGNDSDTVPMMALGAYGVISVASNIIPKDVAHLCDLCLAGDFKAASAEYFRLADFFDKLFIETNPIPVKTAMNLAGMNVGKFRLPLVDMDPANIEKLKVSMRGVGLKV